MIQFIDRWSAWAPGPSTISDWQGWARKERLPTADSQPDVAFSSPNEEACDWPMISALATLHSAAKREGANAVVDIVSFYNRKVYSDSAKYECHTGAPLAGVALRGKLAEIQ